MPDQLPTMIGDGGRGVEAMPVLSVGPTPVNLLNGVSTQVTGEWTLPLLGGRYVWSVTQAAAWGGVTATLQALGDDGLTPQDVFALTANGSKEIIVGQDSQLRVVISGADPASLFSNVAKVQ